jgi:hypothetical protein
VTKAEVTRFPGVGKRADSNTYQFLLRVPKDLQQHFSGPWAVRCSLGTADLHEANSKAKKLQGDWAARFDVLRTGKPAPVDLVALRRKLLTYAERNYLPAADRMSAGYTPAERAEHAQLVAFARDAVLQGIAQGYVPEDAEAWLTAMLGAQRSRVTEGEASARVPDGQRPHLSAARAPLG